MKIKKMKKFLLFIEQAPGIHDVPDADLTTITFGWGKDNTKRLPRAHSLTAGGKEYKLELEARAYTRLQGMC